MSTSTTRAFRPWIIRLTIGSFSVAALMGILALVTGGEFGETEGRILLTTLLVGCASILMLCFLAAGGRTFQALGVVGGLIDLGGTVLGLVMIWAYFEQGPPEAVWKTFTVALVVAVSLAQAVLLLVLAAGRTGAVPRLLALTLLCATGVAGMIVYLILSDGDVGDTYGRALGVVSILDVLGTVVTAALAKFGGRDDALELPADLAMRVRAYAAETGQDPDQVLRSAVEALVAARPLEG